MKGPYYIRKRPDLPAPPVLPCPDWQGIILALRAKGVSLNGLAYYIGRSREHVYSLLAGTRTPEWYSGQLLIHLAKEMGLESVEQVKSKETCSYPRCTCPFDAPADPNWCARGLKVKPRG